MNYSSRSKSIAEQLQALLAYRNTPGHTPEPVKSAWTVVKDEALIDIETSHGLFPEHRLEITPSIAEIERAYKNESGATDPGKIVRNDDRQIVAIGPLRFSDGNQTEKAFTIGPDGDVVQYDRRMPIGAMLGTTEKIGALAGGSDKPAMVEISNSALCAELALPNARYVSGTRKRRKGRSFTRDESVALLAKAIANTTVMPPVKKCPPGIACGTARFSAQFVGMKIGSTGKGGAPNWIDIGVALAEHAAERKAHEEISMSDKATLDAALTARTFKEVGMSAGFSSSYARRAGGRRALIAANDNFAVARKKFAA